MLHDTLLVQQDPQSMRMALAPKVDGVHNLISSTSFMPLSTVYCFSSVATFMGSVGQANYAIANSVLDSICTQYQSCGILGKA